MQDIADTATKISIEIGFRHANQCLDNKNQDRRCRGAQDRRDDWASNAPTGILLRGDILEDVMFIGGSKARQTER